MPQGTLVVEAPIFGLYAGALFFLSVWFSLFLYLGYRMAPIEQNRLLLMVGVAFTVSVLAGILGNYGQGP